MIGSSSLRYADCISNRDCRATGWELPFTTEDGLPSQGFSSRDPMCVTDSLVRLTGLGNGISDLPSSAEIVLRATASTCGTALLLKTANLGLYAFVIDNTHGTPSLRLLVRCPSALPLLIAFNRPAFGPEGATRSLCLLGGQAIGICSILVHWLQVVWRMPATSKPSGADSCRGCK